MNDHFQDIRQNLTMAPVLKPPEPWHLVTSIAVGGLTHIGYAANSDLLLIISSQGRGVIDCLSGDKIACNSEEFFEGLDEIRLLSPGIGPLEKQTVCIAGLSGGGLPICTNDGWRLEAVPLPWPRYSVFLSQPWKSVLDINATTKVGNNGACELRAYGFSETGKTFVIALSCEVTIFSRDAC